MRKNQTVRASQADARKEIVEALSNILITSWAHWMSDETVVLQALTMAQELLAEGADEEAARFMAALRRLSMQFVDRRGATCAARTSSAVASKANQISSEKAKLSARATTILLTWHGACASEATASKLNATEERRSVVTGTQQSAARALCRMALDVEGAEDATRFRQILRSSPLEVQACGLAMHAATALDFEALILTAGGAPRSWNETVLFSVYDVRRTWGSLTAERLVKLTARARGMKVKNW